MFYERKIKYLDYLQNAERLHGAGFVKIEVRENVCNITIQVNGLLQEICGEKDVFLTDGRKEGRLGGIRLERGRGSLTLQGLNADGIGRSGISYETLRALMIPIGTDVQIHCAWSEKPVAESGAEKKEPEQAAAEAAENAPAPAASEAQSEEAAEQMPDASAFPEQTETGKASAEKIPADSIPEKENSLTEQSPVENPPSEPYPLSRPAVHLRESKWKQLKDIYPHIQPFKDRRDYLSITPADFVIFSEKYYRMANNSFLLHGYYNYEHLILARMEKRGEAVYYVGVPGNFYEREKQVALMFGFESFECKEEPARQGDFGYYMMRLQL